MYVPINVAGHTKFLLIQLLPLHLVKRRKTIAFDNHPSFTSVPSPQVDVLKPSPTNIFLKTVFHPSSKKPATLVPLTSAPYRPFVPAERAVSGNPYYPFKNSADFSFASFAVKTRLSKPEISTLLSTQTDEIWSHGPTKLTYRHIGDVFSSLRNAAGTFEKASQSILSL